MFRPAIATIFGAPSLTGAARLGPQQRPIGSARVGHVPIARNARCYALALPPEIMVPDAGETIPEKTTALLGGPGGCSCSHSGRAFVADRHFRVIDLVVDSPTPDRFKRK